MEDDVANRALGFIVEAEVLCLSDPYRIKLRLDHLSYRVEGIGCCLATAGETHPDSLAPLMARGKILADGVVSFAQQCCLQFARRVADQSPFIVAGLVHLAIALEAAVLVQVEEHTTEFVRCQGTLQGVGAEPVWIEGRDGVSRGFIFGHEAKAGQDIEQVLASAQIAVAIATHGARKTSCRRERGAVLWVSPVRIGSDPNVQNPGGAS